MRMLSWPQAPRLNQAADGLDGHERQLVLFHLGLPHHGRALDQAVAADHLRRNARRRGRGPVRTFRRPQRELILVDALDDSGNWLTH
jgi:hypothetical protein